MHPFPHRYSVNALAAPAGVVTLRGQELEDIQSSAPPEFDGPPGNWSPETLFVASIADCYILSFRAVATASKLDWIEIDCAAEGTLEKTAEGNMFTRIDLDVGLRIPAGADAARAERLLEKAEKVCLVSNSIKSEVHLKLRIL
jgi:organic hydroperoxide reductase OsmC/OhrA